jgi:signal peptide peptidase SppA
MRVLDILNSPWAIMPDRLIEIQAIYASHVRGEKADLEAIEARIGSPLQNDPQGYVIKNGAALVPLRGVIAKRMNLFSSISGGASTELLSRDVRAAMDDPEVKSVVLMVDSPGGTVDGTQAAAETIASLRGKKPMATFSDGMIASAAYWIGSAAGEIYIDSGTTQVGSIGVVAGHRDVSKREEMLGVKTTEIVAGQFKRIASQYAPLSESGRAAIQSEVDYLYSVFVSDVAKFRGVSVDVVLSDMADGRTFTGMQAVQAGLVEGIASLDQVIERLNAEATKTFNSSKGASNMTPQDKAVAFAEENPDAAAYLRSLGASAERERIASVRAQSLPGHQALIEQLAADGKTTGAEAAIAVLNAERTRVAHAGAERHNDAPAPVPHASASSPFDDKPVEKASGVIAGADAGDTDKAAKAYMAEHPGTDYITAVKAIQKGE